MVSVLLHLPPALAQRLDRERGTRPRTEVALQWLLAQAGLEAEAAQPPLRRGRPRKMAIATVAQAQVPAPPESLVVEPVSLQLADWEALLKQVPDPRRQADDLPEERVCWRQDGSDGLARLRWRYRQNDPRVSYIKNLGARWETTSDYFAGQGAWILDPQQADRCIAHFQLVDLQPAAEIRPQFGGWSIDVVDCGSQRGMLMEARVDFRAALSAVAKDPARALGLARWLECHYFSDYRWYQVKAESGDLPKGTLICEPLPEDELHEALFQGPSEIAPAVSHHEATRSWRQAWATIILQGQETPDGLVLARPHTGCPGHRVGALFGPFLEAAADGREPLLLRAEWDSAAERARLFGVATEFVPKPPSNLALAFDPAKVPGWETPAQGGQRLFPFQREAVRFALDQDLRCLIGDEMGLGKTASAIASAHAAGLTRVLVVCPLNAVGVWQREIVAWSGAGHPEPKVVVIRATDEAPAIGDAHWVLIGYETLAGRHERIEVKDTELKNALCAFFTKALGKASNESVQ